MRRELRELRGICVVVKDMLNKPRSDALRWNGHLGTLNVPVWATTNARAL